MNIQPAEAPDDYDDGFSTKHTACFHRNPHCISEILKGSVVPNMLSAISIARIQVLKQQVQSLMVYPQKLEAPLLQIKEQHQGKKKKLLESTNSSNKELKRLCSPKVEVNTEKIVAGTAQAEEQARKRQPEKEEGDTRNKLSLSVVRAVSSWERASGEQSGGEGQGEHPMETETCLETAESPQNGEEGSLLLRTRRVGRRG